MPGRLGLIEVCEANRASSPELLALAARYPGVSVLENDCMSECDLCSQACYVFLDGAILHASTLPSLLHCIERGLLDAD